MTSHHHDAAAKSNGNSDHRHHRSLASSQPLLQISDFCQSRRRRHHRRQRPTETSSPLPTNQLIPPIPKAANYNVSVSLSILTTVPGPIHDEMNVDHDSTIYAETVGLLASLHIFQGQICLLTNGDKSVPVIIQLLEKDCALRHSPSEVFHIHVPPMIAAAVGVFPLSHDNLVAKADAFLHLGSISPRVPWNTVSNTSPNGTPFAQSASLMEIAIPPKDFLPSLQTLSMDVEATLHKVSPSTLKQKVREEQRSIQIQSLQTYFSTKRLVSIGSRIGIVEDGMVGVGEKSGGIRFYKVVSMETTQESEGRGEIMPERYPTKLGWISSATKLSLRPRNDSSCSSIDRLPPKSIQNEFAVSTKCSSTCPPPLTKHKPHYMATRIAHVFVQMSSMVNRRDNYGSESAFYHVLHVLGHDDNHLTECIEDAADMGKEIYLKNLDL